MAFPVLESTTRQLTGPLPGPCRPPAPVLPRPNRLTSSEEFDGALRAGSRAGSATLVLHLAAAVEAGTGQAGAGVPRVGLVVSRAVGGAVVRNRVKRRLRHLLRARLAALPPGARVVVRALPAAAAASSARLGRDLDRCLTRVVTR